MSTHHRRPFRFHIIVFLAPATIVYTLFMIWPLADTLGLSFFTTDNVGDTSFVGMANYETLFGDQRWSDHFWNAFSNNFIFFAIHMVVQNPIGILLAALLSMPSLRLRNTYRTLLFMPTLLSVVIVGFVWQLILSPIWGVSSSILDAIGLGSWFAPWLGLESSALVTLSLISVWQYVGIPMLLIYAALLAIPDELIDAAHVDGTTGWNIFWKIKLPLILPTIGVISILTFVGNFNAFDLIYAVKGALAGPDFSTDILGTFLYRTFFGQQLQLGDPNMGATLATMMFLIILTGVCLYLFVIQRRMQRYEL